jgi:LPS sulfotransferase NodH
MALPHTSYLICSTPRTGSSLLCDALTATGIAGRPEEYFQFRARTGEPRRPREYFDGDGHEEALAILGSRTRGEEDERRYDPSRFPRYEDYLTWTIDAGTTPNGVFGAKVMWGYFNGFVTGLRWAIPGRQRLPVGRLAPSVFPNLHHIWMTREDKVAQAVSLWRALQSWSWSSGQNPEQNVAEHLRYSNAAIRHLLLDIELHDREWGRYFDLCEVTPHVVVYEHMRRSVPEAVLGILDHLGISTDYGLSIPQPRRSPQADDLSRQWAQRFREESKTDPELAGQAGPEARPLHAISDVSAEAK